MKIFYVYIYSDPVTDIPFYVGKGKDNRIVDHVNGINRNTKLSSCTRRCKQIIDAGYYPSILKVAENITEDAAFLLEKQLILKYGRLGFEMDGTLLNKSTGGKSCAGYRHSPETKKRLSELKTGNTHHSPETRARISTQTSKALLDPHIRKKISDTHLGKSKTLEHRNKLADHLTRVNQDPVMHAKKTATKRANGTLQHSERTKQKISKTTAKAMSAPEVIERLKVSSKKRWANPEERKKIADKNARTFELTNKQTGESFVITNLAQYCRDHSTNLHRVSREFVVTKMSRGV